MKTAAGTMKIAVLYFSQTGNTAKVAAAIAAAIEPEDALSVDGVKAARPGNPRRSVVLASTSEAPPLDDVDVVFVGMPIIKFGAPEQVRTFFAEQCDGRRVALFVTHAAPVGLPELEPWLEDCRAAADGAELVGFFSCQGQLAEPVKQYMASSAVPELEQFAAMSGCADGQPDEAALKGAAAFADELVARAEAEFAARAGFVTS